MAIAKRERWKESEILAFPAGEHDYFDRKAAPFLDSREAIGKAVSAFANSGGGHILIGVLDDGTIEGVTPMRGRAQMREWLEQVIPSSVSPPLSDFRVHEVTTDVTPSNIPPGRVVLVVDIADSRLAPHQAESQRIYFYREAGHSKAAPIFTSRRYAIGY
jgi:predicted HTH transcriptional regulator